MGTCNLELRFGRLYRELGFGDRYRGLHILRHRAGTRLYRHLQDIYAVSFYGKGW